MRRALLFLLACGPLAGCSFEIEGAACQTPGAPDQCPSGQACGLDRKCAKDAVTDCPDVTGASELAVDPAGGTEFGNGAASPAVCRFNTLAAALTEADQSATAITVKVYGGGSGTTVLDAGSTPPMVVREHVTLTTDSATHDPARFVIRAGQGTGDVLQVEGGARVEGFTIESLAPEGSGVAVVCGGSVGATATLANVVVDGKAHLANGVRVTGACSLDATSLEIKNATGAGLLVATTAVTAGAAVTGGAVHDNGGEGIVANAGVVSLHGTTLVPLTISRNAGGVRIEQSGGNVNAKLEGLRVVDNTKVGLFLSDISTSKAIVTDTLFARNSFTEYGPAGGRRNAGGVLVQGVKPPNAADFRFQGNAVCHNGDSSVDEIAFYSSADWSIAGDPATPNCSAGSRNRFANPSSDGRLVHSVTGSVDAQLNYFIGDPPSPIGFSANVSYSPTCGEWPSPPSDCL
jgi:hypothetical protein